MKKKIMMTISVVGVNVLGNATNIMASPVSGVGVATSTGIPEIDNALNIIKALFIGLIFYDRRNYFGKRNIRYGDWISAAGFPWNV